ncbi:MAG: enoyl-CoA hydratase/isomerase family protein [Candidatus Binataceae bacterium]
MDFSQIIYDKSDGVATIIFNRPERLNAFTWTIHREMREAVLDADQDDSIGAIVVTGAGKSFCAGLDVEDLRTISQGGKQAKAGMPEERQAMFVYLTELKKPVIGALNGHSVGIGLALTLYFDIRIVGESSKMSFIFVQRGLAPELGTSWILPRLIGFGPALEMALTGRMVGAREALELKLVNRVVPDDQLLASAQALAREIAVKCTPLGVAEAKRSFYRHQTVDLATALIDNEATSRKMNKSEDFKEALKAFAEKRAPRFKGR